MCVRVRSLLFRKSLVKFIIFIVWRCIECVLSAWTFYSNTQSRRSAMFFRCWLLCPVSMLIFKTVDSVKNFNISIIKNENGITKLWSHLNGAVNGLFLPLALSLPFILGASFHSACQFCHHWKRHWVLTSHIFLDLSLAFFPISLENWAINFEI